MKRASKVRRCRPSRSPGLVDTDRGRSTTSTCVPVAHGGFIEMAVHRQPPEPRPRGHRPREVDHVDLRAGRSRRIDRDGGAPPAAGARSRARHWSGAPDRPPSRRGRPPGHRTRACATTSSPLQKTLWDAVSAQTSNTQWSFWRRNERCSRMNSGQGRGAPYRSLARCAPLGRNQWASPVVCTSGPGRRSRPCALTSGGERLRVWRRRGGQRWVRSRICIGTGSPAVWRCSTG